MENLAPLKTCWLNRAMKRIFLFLLFFYPPGALGTGTADLSLDQEVSRAAQRLQGFDRSLSLQDRKILKETPHSGQESLGPRLRRLHKERQSLRGEGVFWGRASRLKADILRLPEERPLTGPERVIRIEEAEVIAESAIRAFGEVAVKFDMVRPAILHNVLVNTGFKDEGLCWHWARDLWERLARIPLKHYEFIWVTAHEGKAREHNALVVTSRGRTLEEGLVFDGWRKSGKPFWTPVSRDRYPWKLGRYAGDEGPRE